MGNEEMNLKNIIQGVPNETKKFAATFDITG